MSRNKLCQDLKRLLLDHGWEERHRPGNTHTIFVYPKNGATLTLGHSTKDTGRKRQNYLSLIKKLEAQ